MSRPALHLSEKQDWMTPTNVVACVRSALNGWIDLDPCASPDERFWLAEYNVTASPAVLREGEHTYHEQSPKGLEGDGLARPWVLTADMRHPRVFVNPPFNRLKHWAAKCAEEARKGAEVVLLLPARTDTRYWHDHVTGAAAVAFWRGRVRFLDHDRLEVGSSTFPTALAYWGPHPQRFRDAFTKHAHVLLQ